MMIIDSDVDDGKSVDKQQSKVREERRIQNCNRWIAVEWHTQLQIPLCDVWHAIDSITNAHSAMPCYAMHCTVFTLYFANFPRYIHTYNDNNNNGIYSALIRQCDLKKNIIYTLCGT